MKKICSILVCIMLILSMASSCMAEESESPVVFEIANNRSISGGFDFLANPGTEHFALEYLWADPLIHSIGDGTYTPWLATDWEYAEDGMSVTFHLRDDVTFQNGQPFTSRDVKVSFERLITDPTMKIAHAWNAHFDHVETPDDYTAVVCFSSIFPNFLYECSSVVIVNADLYEEDSEAYVLNPVGTGAFMVSDYDNVNSKCTFTRYDDWWGYQDGKTSNVDQIIYTTVSEDATRVSALRAEEFDMIMNVPNDNIEILTSEGFKVEQYDGWDSNFLQFNCAEGSIFSDKAIREAVSLSIDRQALVDSILGGGVPLYSALMPGCLGYTDDQYQGYDIDKAKEILASSSYNGEQIELCATSDGRARITELMQAMQSMMQAAGFNVTVNMVETAILDEKEATGNYDILLIPFGCADAEPYKLFTDVIQADIWGSSYQNDAVNALIDQTSNEFDLEKRAEITAELNKALCEDYGRAFIYTTGYAVGMAGNVSGVELSRSDVYYLQYVNIDQ